MAIEKFETDVTKIKTDKHEMPDKPIFPDSDRKPGSELPTIGLPKDIGDIKREPYLFADSDRKNSDGPEWDENNLKDINNAPERYDRRDTSENTDNNEATKNCPVENGTWENERGNSKWIPNPEYAPQKKNPEKKTWEEILDEFDIDGINFKDGEPDFSEVSKGNVEIESFSTNRDDNFDKADIALAKQRGCSPEEVENWRKENGYTWHECKDMKTMQKVPSIIHNNVSHRGGISEAKGGSQ